MKLKRNVTLKFTILFLIFLIGWSSSFPIRGQEDDIQNLINEANTLYNRSSYDSAMMIYESALNIIDTVHDRSNFAFLIRKKGTCFIHLSKYDSALFYLNKAVKLAKEVNNDQVLADAEMSIGYVYRIKTEKDSSKVHFLRAYELFRSLNDSVGMAKIGHNLSEFYKTVSTYDSALWYALRTHKTFKKLGDTALYVRSLINLGNVYDIIGSYDSALSCYTIAYKLSERIPDYWMINKIHINRGTIYYRQGIYLKARSELLIAKDYFEEINNTHELSVIYSNLILTFKKLGELDKAIDYGKKALETAEEEGNEELKLSSLNNIGQAYSKKGDLQMASSYLYNCLDLAIKSQYKGELKNVYSSLSGLYVEQGDYKMALDFYMKSDSVAGLIMNIAILEEINRLNAEYELQKHKDNIRIKDLELKETRLERNLVYGISVFVVSLLIWLALFYSMRLRKNRIISNQKIKQLEDEKRLLAAQSVIVGQEKERKRIARELHDGIGVLLSTAKIQFSSIEDDKSNTKTNEIFRKAHHMLDKAGKEVRRISHDMMPGVLSKFGLREALEDMFEDLEDISELEIDLKLHCSDERLPDNTEIMLYRVVQEMVNNTIKHAQAKKITCTITRKDDSIEIEYADDGIGFDEKSLPHNKSLGLFGIRSRIDFLSGTVEIQNEEGKGSRFSIFVPLTQDIKRG